MLGAAPGPRWIRALAWAVARLPFRATRWMGAWLGWLAGSVLRIRRRQVEESLRLGGVDPSIAPRVYRSLADSVFELLWMEGAGKARARTGPAFEMSEATADALRRAHAHGRGVVVATAHTGNWDLNACGAARWAREQIDASVTVVTKRLSWEALDRYWQRLRAQRGVTLVPPEGATTRVLAALRGGGLVALLVDQAPGPGPRVIRADFLGRPARHDLSPALLAARARAPMVVVSGFRTDAGVHRLELLDEIPVDELAGGRPSLERVTRRVNVAIERFVAAHPTQWLWLHRRWK